MPDQAVDCIITAPPAWTPEVDPTQAHQELASYGHEPTAALYVAALRRLLAEAHLMREPAGWSPATVTQAKPVGGLGPRPVGIPAAFAITR